MKYARMGLGLLLAASLAGARLPEPSGQEPGAPEDTMAWSSDWSASLARAKLEGKPIFVALNMDGE